MKSYKHLYKKCLSEENRREAVRLVKKSKRIKRIIKRRHLSDDALVSYAYDYIVNYDIKEHKPVKIIDGTNRKERTIIVPSLEELLVQHCVINAIKPVFMRGMYEHSYASIPKRGAHKAKKLVEKWIRKDPKNCKYVLKMDIRHFFDSVPHENLKAKLADVIRDEEMIDLLFKIIDETDSGVPLGFYTSQWLSNWYLQAFDHFVKEKLRVKYYVRYMDDMVIFGRNKKELHRIRAAISNYLSDYLGLNLKGNWQVFLFSYIKGKDEKGKDKDMGRDLDFMGFRFYRNRTALRRSIMLKASRKARKIFRKQKPTIYDARQMLSYLGWIDATSTYKMYLKHIKPYICFGAMKQKISRYDLHSDKRIYARLAKIYIMKGGRKNEFELRAS